jgi:nitrous oxidase accessory protein NosD
LDGTNCDFATIRSVNAMLGDYTRSACISLLVAVLLLPGTTIAAGGRTLKVGPELPLKAPSAAAAMAQQGDVIEIASGTYADCAVWPSSASSITIRAMDNGPVVVTGKVCELKALFVIKADDVTVRGITFSGARAFTHNGAGIRAEGRNLTVDGSRFLDNEEGILAAPRPESAIVIRDSYFKGNGNCISATGCAHGIYIGPIASLLVAHCTFIEQHTGHHIKSRAERTELIDNIIEDGPDGTASYLVDIPNGGALIMRDNILEKGPKSENSMAAVILGEEGNTNVTPEIIIENNRFTNNMPQETLFVRNLTGTTAVLQANQLTGLVRSTERGAQ